MEFGRYLGMTTVWIASDPGRQKAGAESDAISADLQFESLSEAVDALL